MNLIPNHSLEDIERSREEMAAFMNEKHVPDLTLTGEDIHRAYRASVSGRGEAWENVSERAKERYAVMAQELNRELDARMAWTGPFEDVTISAIRCPQCYEMLQAEHAEGHACWLEVKPC